MAKISGEADKRPNGIFMRKSATCFYVCKNKINKYVLNQMGNRLYKFTAILKRLHFIRYEKIAEKINTTPFVYRLGCTLRVA